MDLSCPQLLSSLSEINSRLEKFSQYKFSGFRVPGRRGKVVKVGGGGAAGWRA